MFLVILCMVDTVGGAANMMHGAADKMRGVANTMHGAADMMNVRCGGWARISVTPPPICQKTSFF